MNEQHNEFLGFMKSITNGPFVPGDTWQGAEIEYANAASALAVSYGISRMLGMEPWQTRNAIFATIKARKLSIDMLAGLIAICLPHFADARRKVFAPICAAQLQTVLTSLAENKERLADMAQATGQTMEQAKGFVQKLLGTISEASQADLACEDPGEQPERNRLNLSGEGPEIQFGGM